MLTDNICKIETLDLRSFIGLFNQYGALPIKDVVIGNSTDDSAFSFTSVYPPFPFRITIPKIGRPEMVETVAIVFEENNASVFLNADQYKLWISKQKPSVAQRDEATKTGTPTQPVSTPLKYRATC